MMTSRKSTTRSSHCLRLVLVTDVLERECAQRRRDGLPAPRMCELQAALRAEAELRRNDPVLGTCGWPPNFMDNAQPPPTYYGEPVPTFL